MMISTRLPMMSVSTPQRPASAAVEKEFTESFQSGYEPRYCGKNIKNLLARLPQEELEGAKVLGIENKGLSWFGMVRAMQARDTKGNGQPYVTDRNWYHHVVLEKDGKIFDYDHGIVPTTPGVQKYFDDMFLLKDDKVKPADKLKDYEVQVIDAKEYLTGTGDTSSKVRFAEYLGEWANKAKFTVTALQ